MAAIGNSSRHARRSTLSGVAQANDAVVYLPLDLSQGLTRALDLSLVGPGSHSNTATAGFTNEATNRIRTVLTSGAISARASFLLILHSVDRPGVGVAFSLFAVFLFVDGLTGQSQSTCSFSLLFCFRVCQSSVRLSKPCEIDPFIGSAGSKVLYSRYTPS